MCHMALSIKQFLKDYLTSQGVQPSEWESIIHPTEKLEHDPFEILGAREWCQALFEHKDDVITIVGDYDADGVLSAATMRSGLETLGVGRKINTYVPTRMDGYGITPTSVTRLREQFPDTETIITTDNGVAAFEGVQAAKDAGWTVLVTDHHLAKNDGLPVADAIVDINRPGDNYPFKGISGTAMAYKMLLAYASVISPQYLRIIQRLRTLVGISAVTDMMPMRDENRFYTKHAIDEVQQMVQGIVPPASDPHIAALIQSLSNQGKIYGKEVDDTIFGFTIGPMLNAPSRVTGSPKEAYDFFMETDPEKRLERANALIETNEYRKQVVGDLGGKVLADFQTKLDQGEDIVAMATKVPLTSGFVGLIAGRITQKFNCPAIVFSTVDFDGQKLIKNDDVLHGSARSVEGLSIVEIMQEMKNRDDDVILGFGGHAAAAGLTIKAGRFEDFCTLFNEVTAEKISQQALVENDTSNNQSSAIFDINPEDVSMNLLASIKQMIPFGQNFVRPLFRFTNIDSSRATALGAHSQHIKITLQNPKFEILNWNSSDDFIHMGTPNQMNITGEIGVSAYSGRNTFQMVVSEWEAVD